MNKIGQLMIARFSMFIASFAVRIFCFTILWSVVSYSALGEEFTDAIRAYLQNRGKTDARDGGIVTGLVDEQGSRIISFGKLSNGTDEQVNGDTVFGIYSQTCIYTGLLLQDMVERGEMKLDDPVAKYLPKSVNMPTRNGKQITLRHLLTETAGLPDFAEKLAPKRVDNPYADYTVEKMYAFLSDYQLARDPGAQFVHGGTDVGLLGHVIALKAGTDYESLVVERICKPLQMGSTRFTLTPELKSRLVTTFNPFGYDAAKLDWGVLKPLAGLHSTANDLLKFVSANLGFTESSLTPLLEKHVGHFVWGASQEPGVVHIGGGGTAGGSVYTGFDKTQHRGVVVLTASGSGRSNARALGKFLLECEWRSDRRPTETKIASEVYGSYTGQYQRSPDFALGIFATRQFFHSTRKAAIYIPTAICLAALLLLLWRVASSRKRRIILGCAILACALLAPLLVLASGHMFCARCQPRIAIRADGNRLFAEAAGLGLWPIGDWHYAQATGLGSQPIDAVWPPVPTELLAESETDFFERLSATPITFSRDPGGNVTGLSMRYRGKAYSYAKVSDQPPKSPEPPKPRVAVKLDARLLDACVGHYAFPPDAISPSGMKLKVWREGDQLIGQVQGENCLRGAIDIYPESETDFFVKIDGAQLTFTKNQGEVTAVTHHIEGHPAIEGKKLKGE